MGRIRDGRDDTANPVLVIGSTEQPLFVERREWVGCEDGFSSRLGCD